MKLRLLGALVLALLASPAFAATSHLYISEYQAISSIAWSRDNAQIAQEPSTDQPIVDYTSGVTASNAFAAGTTIVRLLCTSTCSVLFSAAGTNATTSNKVLAAGVAEYFGVAPGMKVSVIANTDF